MIRTASETSFVRCSAKSWNRQSIHWLFRQDCSPRPACCCSDYHSQGLETLCAVVANRSYPIDSTGMNRFQV